MTSYVQKMGIAAGSVSLAAVPTMADAALSHVTGSPVSVSFLDVPTSTGGAVNVPWDVDGQDGADFSLVGALLYGFESSTASGAKSEFRFGYNFIYAGTFNTGGPGLPLNGAAIGVANDVVGGGAPFLAPLPNSFVVGPTVGPYSWIGGIAHGAAVARYFSTGGSLTNQSTSSYYPGAASGTFNIGFLFNSSAGLHAGWANVTVDNGPDWQLTINEWVYESDPETPVHVPDVPVPATIVPAIAMLGLGAAGLRRMRKRKSTQAE